MSLVTLFLRLALEILAIPILLLLSIDLSKFGIYNESSDFCLKGTRAMKVARFNETFPQAGLRRLGHSERDAAHRAAETPEQF
ncbi:hypothetical protein TNCV_1563221 [Trichonephila clavipes]|nr:hypothetical protein TNCV_1563221 [Trichonephila clavipes]